MNLTWKLISSLSSKTRFARVIKILQITAVVLLLFWANTSENEEESFISVHFTNYEFAGFLDQPCSPITYGKLDITVNYYLPTNQSSIPT